MQYFSIPEYIFISVAAYLCRFLVDKLFIYYKPIKEFYNARMILPSVKIWESSRRKFLYEEIFSIVETFLVAIIYILVYWTIPLYGFQKGFIFILPMFVMSSIVKSKFALVETNYPMSLFIFDMLRTALSYAVITIVLVLMYKPISF